MQLPCSKLSTICGFPALHSVAAGAPLPVAFECRVYRVVPSGFSINGQRTNCLWKVTRSFLPCMPCFCVLITALGCWLCSRMDSRSKLIACSSTAFWSRCSLCSRSSCPQSFPPNLIQASTDTLALSNQLRLLPASLWFTILIFLNRRWNTH